MRIVIAPDSFKESLSAAEVAEAMAAGVRDVLPGAEIDLCPMADGGEGTVEAMVSATGGRLCEVSVIGPLRQPRVARFGLLGGGQTAVIEMAEAAGLTLVPPDRRNPLLTTTFGVGQVILAALDAGARHLVIGIGGSATVDGGVGCAQALGVVFVGHAKGSAAQNPSPLEGEGPVRGGEGCRPVRPGPAQAARPPHPTLSLEGERDEAAPLTLPSPSRGEGFKKTPPHQALPCGLGGGDLKRITRIDASDRDRRVAEARVEVACDVTNPLTGPNGAAVVYGPQKGATPDMVKTLDAGLAHLAELIRRDLGMDVQTLPGTGAAGGLGAGLVAFAGATLRRGVEIVADAVGLRRRLAGAALVITGEGKFDSQSASGKTAVGVARIAAEMGVPAVCIPGQATADAPHELFRAVCPLVNPATPVSEAMARTAELVRARTAEAVRRVLP
jgi:glycerate kinase